MVTIRLRGYSPAIILAGLLCAALVIGAFLYPLYTMLSGRPKPPDWLIAAFVAGAVSIAVMQAWKRSRHIREGRDDLIVDRKGQLIDLPYSFGRNAQTIIPYEQINEIFVVSKDPTLPKEHENQRFSRVSYRPGVEVPPAQFSDRMRYWVIVGWRDGGTEIADNHESPLVMWTSAQRACAFAEWLRQTCAR